MRGAPVPDVLNSLRVVLARELIPYAWGKIEDTDHWAMQLCADDYRVRKFSTSDNLKCCACNTGS
jgi:hypothetical protein